MSGWFCSFLLDRPGINFFWKPTVFRWFLIPQIINLILNSLAEKHSKFHLLHSFVFRFKEKNEFFSLKKVFKHWLIHNTGNCLRKARSVIYKGWGNWNRESSHSVQNVPNFLSIKCIISYYFFPLLAYKYQKFHIFII